MKRTSPHINAARESAREGNGEFGTQIHGEATDGTNNQTMGAPLVTFPIAEVVSGTARRIASDPETWARKCPQCRAIFTVEGDYSDVGSLTSDIAFHVTQAHNEYERDARAAGEIDPTLVREVTDPATTPLTGVPIGSMSNPINIDDPRVHRGEVFDTLRRSDGTLWHRARKGFSADWPYEIRLQADRELTDDEKHHASQLLGYQYRSTVAGERLGQIDSDTPFSFSVYADTSKSSRGSIGSAICDLEDGLPCMMENGSPARTTDRQGPKGSQLVEGFGPNAPQFEIYYDSIYVKNQPVLRL